MPLAVSVLGGAGTLLRHQLAPIVIVAADAAEEDPGAEVVIGLGIPRKWRRRRRSHLHPRVRLELLGRLLLHQVEKTEAVPVQGQLQRVLAADSKLEQVLWRLGGGSRLESQLLM